MFAPEDLTVVKGDPDQRRRYLDDLLVANRPRFAGIRADYDRVLRQRTALVRSVGAMAASGSVPPALEVWDDQLVARGAELTAGRLELTAALRPLVAKAYAAVSGEDLGAAMSYRQASAGGSQEDTEPSADRGGLAEGLRQALARARRAGVERGVCLVGPHRDELGLRIGELPARG